MPKYRKGAHTSSRLTVHLVWVTKYRYHVLVGEVQSRCRDLLIQDCESLDIEILKGVVSKDHIHMHIEYPPKLSVSVILNQLKGRSSRLLQKEFPHLKNDTGGNTFGQLVMEPGVQEILLMKWFKTILSIIEGLQINLKTTFCLSNKKYDFGL